MSPEPVPLPTRVFLACGVTDMRKGFDGLAVLVQQVLAQNPHSGALFAFRGRRGHLVKLLWFDGQGLCLFSKRLDRGRFVWPVTATGTVTLTPAQLSMLLEGIDWRRPERTFTPTLAGRNRGFASLLLARCHAICYEMGVSEASVSPADAAARIAALEASLARANAALAARDLLIDTLRGQIARLRRMQFGASSEKLGREIEQLELALEELETEHDAPVPEAADDGVAARPVAVRSLPGHLPREEVVHEPASGACTCPNCGGALRPLGSDVHEMLDIVPVRWRVVRNVRPKYSCRSCEKIVQAPAPVSAVGRGKATFATLAHVVVSKFDHHLPLYRQAGMMVAQGLDIDRSTLAGWTGQTAALLDPIVTRIRDEVLKADKIHADDTPVPVLDPGRGKTATGRLWVYAVDDRASGSTTPRATWYRFTPDRTAAHPLAHLAGFRGFLQADAYAGYDGLYRSGVTEVACWAHFRRKVFDLHERSPTPLTTDILERIGTLYAVEAEVRGQPPDVRYRSRQENSRPLVEALRAVLDAALRRLSPKSDMARAIAYGTKRWPALSRFLDDGRLEIDNNIAERALRGIAVGRRNWLFAGSRAGGERAAAIYTVIQTCKANGIDPQAYIANVIAKVAGDWPACRWDELMPWNWMPPVDQPNAQAA